ncbi:MAG: agmatinase [Candidatus Altiarchaeota archaeon]
MAPKSPVFCGLDASHSGYANARFVVLPVPYELTTSYGKGAARGPAAILEASRYLELYDEELDCTPAECGIATLQPLSIKAGPEVMIRTVEASVGRVLADGKFPVVFGGEHSVSVGVAKAVADMHCGVSVLQFDAHSDLRESYGGSRYSHACAMARIREFADTVHVGIRSLGDDEADLVKRLRAEGKLYFASDVLQRDRTADIISALKEKVFITFDVDGFDPSIMPSTGTPEPGGLGWYDSLKILKSVIGEREVVGFDLMELSPEKNKSPDFLAAKLAYKVMGYVSCRKSG